jgi:hypothetical protein
MRKAFKCIGHNDHGITQKQFEYIQNHQIFKIKKEGELVKEIVILPKELGLVLSSLYGPSIGDGVIKESEVFYMERGGRNGRTRMIKKPKRLTNRVTVIGIICGPAFTMYGTQSDKPSPMEVWDKKFKYLSSNEQEEIRKFWKVHAISSY